jgi:hypothetical protein
MNNRGFLPSGLDSGKDTEESGQEHEMKLVYRIPSA